MLLINGALAAFNGFLVATCKAFCECVRGGVYCGGVCRCPEEEGGEVEGECCGDEWYTEEGECCGDEWYTEPGECCDDKWIDEDGAVDGLEGEWVCCNDSNGTVTFRILAPADPGCEGLVGRCCTDGNCTEVPAQECAGEVLSGSCARFGCPKSCCNEDSDGLVTCETVDELLCTGTVDEEPCETACKGACCVEVPVGLCQYTAPGGGQFGGAGGGDVTQSFTSTEDECNAESLPAGAYDISWTETSTTFLSIGDTTQSECDEQDGYWQGLGETACSYINEGEEGHCRPPFSTDCCERVVSSAARLTFRGPRNRRYPELDSCGFQVTVTVATGQPVYIHGGLFGAPYEACTDTTTFLLCNDEFYVTPAPCSGNLQNLDIEVCWADASGGPETLRFRCCQDITYLLGNCGCDCVTTLLYEGPGCTSNAVIQMRGDAVIEASGTGPLVLTQDITQAAACERTLTLGGTNTDLNSVASIPGTNLSVTKTGPGLWRLTKASNFDGRFTVLDGTIVAAVGVGQTGSGVFGGATAVNNLPLVGDSSPGVSGAAIVLLEAGVLVDRGLTVAALGSGSTQTVTLGMTGNSGTATFGGGGSIELGRDVILRASTGCEAVFRNDWLDLSGGGQPAVAFTIGAPDNLGTVVIETFFPNSITLVTVFSGATAKMNPFDNETINRQIPVVLETASTLDLNGTDQPLESLEMHGSATVTNGVLQTLGTIQVSGSGNLIASNVSIDAATTMDVSGSLTVSGDVSGSFGITKDGSGTLTLEGDITYTGETSITGGTLIVEKEFAASADISLVTFTPTTLVVAFTTTPVSAATYQLLGGSTAQTYGVGLVTLTGAGGATGTYDSATSTLTID
jgi:autotransporter-associated beta strand protein